METNVSFGKGVKLVSDICAISVCASLDILKVLRSIVGVTGLPTTGEPRPEAMVTIQFPTVPAYVIKPVDGFPSAGPLSTMFVHVVPPSADKRITGVAVA